MSKRDKINCKYYYKITVVILAVLFIVSITGCSRESGKDNGSNTINSTEKNKDTVGETKSGGQEDTAGEEDATTNENLTKDENTSGEEGTSGADSKEHPVVPDFTLESSGGEKVSLSDYEGKIVVLNFWASWCPPCKAEMPDFQKLYEDIEDSEDTVLFMLNQTDGQRETTKDADKYVEDENFTFPVLYDTGEVGYKIFGITSIPTTVVIDKEGRLSDYVMGTTEYDVVAGMIEEAR